MEQRNDTEDNKKVETMNRKKTSHETVMWLSSMTGKMKVCIVLLSAVQAVLGVNSIVYAMLLREIMNAATAGLKDKFVMALFILISVLVLHIILGMVYRFFGEFTRASLENKFKKKLFEELLEKDYAQVTRMHSGEWMNRLTSDTVVVADGITQIIPGAAGMGIKLMGALAAILYLEPKLFYFAVPGGVLLIGVTYGFRRRLKGMHKQIQEADGELRTFFQERIGSMMIVRAFGQEKCTAQNAAELMRKHRTCRMRRNHFSNLCSMGFSTAMNGMYALGIGFCGYGILNGTMNYGDFAAMLQLIAQIQNPFANLTGFLPKYYAMLASAERLREAESFKVDEEKKKSAQELENFYKEQFLALGLEKAVFAYKTPGQMKENNAEIPTVLSGVNLEIRKGEHVMFTGSSGCGKSTVLKLLMCFYSLDAGRRYLLTKQGEQPLTPAWRNLFAYVPQGNHLFAGTIRETIAFGDAEKMRQDGQIRKVLQIACADEFVSQLEQGLDTVLGERGTGLSEGQLQRLAIARAVFSQRPILLLDEATSALDEKTAEKILENLRVMTDKTVIIVTHRSTTRLWFEKEVSFSKNGIMVKRNDL